MNRRSVLRVGCGLLAAAISGCSGDGGESGSGVNLNHSRRQLEKYTNHETALDDGYENMDVCVDGLGVPFVNQGVDQVTYDQPHILLYDRTADGKFELLGAEWFVPADEVDDPPSVWAGEPEGTMDGPMEGHYATQPRHYGLHAWLFTENPNGLFANTHPVVTCSK